MGPGAAIFRSPSLRGAPTASAAMQKPSQHQRETVRMDGRLLRVACGEKGTVDIHTVQIKNHHFPAAISKVHCMGATSERPLAIKASSCTVSWRRRLLRDACFRLGAKPQRRINVVSSHPHMC